MQRTRAGFSLIELLVAIAILGIITVHILGIFSTQMQSYEGQKAIVETQSDARLALDLVFRDVRMAGFMVPQAGGISGADGGPGNTDMLCVSDPSVLNDNRVVLATERFGGASLANNLGVATTVDLTVADLDIDGDGDADFAVNSGIIIVDGTNTHCARITNLNVATGDVIFTPVTPLTFAANIPNARAVPAVVYERSPSGLLRNFLVVSRQIEDFQVEYGVDGDGDGQLVGGEFPVHGMNGSDPTRVRLVRLSILTRTMREHPTLSGLGRQAVANRTAGPQDDYRRRLVSVSAAPRNLL